MAISIFKSKGNKGPKDIRALREMREEAINVKKLIDGKALISSSFYSGDQYVKWSKTNNRLEYPTFRDPRIRRVTFNVMRGYVNGAVSLLARPKHKPEVSPATDDYEDIATARVSQKVLDFVLYEKLNYLDINRRLFLYLYLGGTASKYVEWEPEGGDFINVHKVMGKDNTEHLIGPYEGEVKVTPLPVWMTHYDPAVIDLRDSSYVFIDLIKSKNYIRTKWGKDAADGVESSSDSDLMFNSRIFNAGGMYSNRSVKEAVTVTLFFEKPSQKHPGGQYTVFSGDKILQEPKDLPYKHKRLPVVPYIFDHSPIGPYGESPGYSLVEIQTEFNRTFSQITMNKDMFAKLKWFVARGSDLKVTSIDNMVGEKVEYNPGLPRPEAPTPPALPAYMTNYVDKMIDLAKFIGMYQEVSQGSIPPGVEAAAAISLLQEQDMSKYGPVMDSFWDSEKNVCFQLLQLMKQYYVEPRTIKITGRKDEFEVIEFHASDIKANYDIRFSPGSALSLNKTAKIQQISALISQGLFDMNDPKQKKIVFELMEFGDVGGDLFQRETVEYTYAKDLLNDLKRGRVIDQLFEWEPNLVIIGVLEEYLLGKEAKTAEPEILQNIMDHRELRVKAEEQKLEVTKNANQISNAAQAGGGGGQPVPEGIIGGGPPGIGQGPNGQEPVGAGNNAGGMPGQV